MERSAYLVQALQQLGAEPASSGFQAPDIAALAATAQKAKAFRKDHPGQSYAMQGLRQMGQNLMGAPGRLGGLFGLGAGVDVPATDFGGRPIPGMTRPHGMMS